MLVENEINAMIAESAIKLCQYLKYGKFGLGRPFGIVRTMEILNLSAKSN